MRETQKLHEYEKAVEYNQVDTTAQHIYEAFFEK